MKVNTSDRLKYIIQTKGLRQVDILNKCKPFCEKYGIKLQKSELSQYISGRYEPSQSKLTVLSLALGVPETWLMGYDVPMTDISVDDELPKNTADISEDEKLLIDLFRSVPDDKKKLAIEMIRAALKAQ